MSELLASLRSTIGEKAFWLPGLKTKNREKQNVSSFSMPEQEQLRHYAEAFEGLARMFQKLPCQKTRLGDEDLEWMFQTAKAAACTGCDREMICWGNEYFSTCQLLYQILEDLENGKERKLSAVNGCTWPEHLWGAMESAYGQARINLLWQNRMLEQRMAAGEQIAQTAALLAQTADAFRSAPDLEQRIRGLLLEPLGEAGVTLQGVRVFWGEGNRKEIYLTMGTVDQSCVAAKTIAAILTHCMNVPMRPAWNCRNAVYGEPTCFHFVPDTKYQIFCGISRITKEGEMISGDNYAFLQKDTGKVVMSLADGMGSGAAACEESKQVIELLEQFLDAGFPQETAVKMINSCMLMQSGQQMYSTIDLCMIDLYNARCDMIKSGAASTFILQNDQIEVVRSSSFPTGIMQQADYESMHRQLVSGSTVVMMTDGVLEALPEEDRERQMAELIGRTASRNAKEHAKRLMERVYLMENLQAKDDMTILVGSIWEK